MYVYKLNKICEVALEKCHFKIYIYAHVYINICNIQHIYIHIYIYICIYVCICVLQGLEETITIFGHKNLWNTVTFGLPSKICHVQPGIFNIFLLRSTLKLP